MLDRYKNLRLGAIVIFILDRINGRGDCGINQLLTKKLNLGN